MRTFCWLPAEHASLGVSLIILSLAWSSAPLYAAASSETGETIVARVEFTRGPIKHTYSLARAELSKAASRPGSLANTNYDLTFAESRKALKHKTLTDHEAQLLKNEINHLIWESQYRSGKRLEKCTTYATLSVDSEKAKICNENKSTSAKAFGLLNSLHEMF